MSEGLGDGDAGYTPCRLYLVCHVRRVTSEKSGTKLTELWPGCAWEMEMEMPSASRGDLKGRSRGDRLVRVRVRVRVS